MIGLNIEMDHLRSAPMERRRFERKRVLMSGKLVFNKGYSTMNCQIRNAGKLGMGVRLPDMQGVPDHIRVMLDRDSSLYNANVIWRRHDGLGLEIVSEAL